MIRVIYAHLARKSPLEVGDRVSQGAIIGEIGNTGNSTSTHLHYEQHASSNFNRATAYIPTFKEYPNEIIRAEKAYTSQNTGKSSQLSNITGLISTHRGGNGEVYINWENGGWKSPAVKVIGPYGPITTNYSPTVIRDKFGRIQLFHVGISGEIYQMILRDDGTWSTRGLGYFTDKPVSVVLHENFLNIFFKDLDNNIFSMSSGDNESFGQARKVIDWQSELQPAVTVRGNQILLAITGINNHIYSYLGTKSSNLSGPYEIEGLRTSKSIALSTYNNYFIMIHVGDNTNVYQNRSLNGRNWSNPKQVPGLSTYLPVSLGVQDNLLRLAHVGKAGHIYYQSSSSHSLGFSTPVKEHENNLTPAAVGITHVTQNTTFYAD